VNYLLTRILRFVGGRLDGYKMRICGYGSALTGILGLLGVMFPEQGLPVMTATEAVELVLIGFGVNGAAHKAEKHQAEIATQTEVIRQTVNPSPAAQDGLGAIGAEAGGP